MIFKNVPLPPSSNNQYRSFMSGGRIRHVASQELVAFKKSMEYYWLEHSKELIFARDTFSGYPINVSIEFRFLKSRLITKKGSFKRLDVSNRLKAVHDCFASALLIDDSCFVKVSAEKQSVEKEECEGATVTLSICDFVENE